MDQRGKRIKILMADDDEDDRMMMKEALEEACLADVIHFVEDGEELMDYLRRRGVHAEARTSTRPDLILLDLNMPKRDGREALKEIKRDPDLRRIPIVVLTTSKAEEDVYRTYDLGANSYITKPASFEELIRTVKTLVNYWFEIVILPAG
ncbi:MAG: two-component system response regulator [Nitrospirae bacterium GWC2_57_13]|jgi:CheY-like chemotaxis protein|nr:MAG: two-component system response regulator [Nitrospirae bacterium GWC2_57_13]OGW42275.1 MAG: two-component system response regulator [Nitrospirae bacterium GWD2_57_8]